MPTRDDRNAETAMIRAVRARAVQDAGEACIQWVTDTGDCHFCSPILDSHEEHCPLRDWFRLMMRATKGEAT